MNPETVAKWISALGGRRFLLCIGCSLVNSVFYSLGLPVHAPMTESGYLMILGGTVFAYVAVNTTQKIQNKESDK